MALALLLGVLLLGAWGYHVLEQQSWLDAMLNAVVITTGLGVISALATPGAKLFTVFYALFSAFVFYSTLAILFSPVLHRFLHHFHLDSNNKEGGD